MPSLSYAQLDAIADLYNPLLLLCSLAFIARSLYKYGIRRAAAQLLVAFISLLIVYGMMGLDNQLRLWPRWGLDYSTHTAFALALVLFLWVCGKYRWLWPCTFVAYLVLMVYQGYHSPADIVTTIAVVGPLCGSILLLYWRLSHPSEGARSLQ